VRDVGRVELGSNLYALRSLLDNKPAVAIAIFQRPGTNALEASDQVRKTMERLKQSFPQGVDYRIVYDPTSFVRNSIRAVVETLFEAILLVVLVVMVFLQTVARVDHPARRGAGVAHRHVRGDARLRLLAEHAVALRPRSLDRHCRGRCDCCRRERRAAHRTRLSPIAATRLAMEEVSGPIIAIALVLLRSVRADGLRQRAVGAVLSAVCADDRDFNGHLGDQLADAEPGARLATAQAA
jgi:hypothetical protein